MKVGVLTISDRVCAGQYEDKSGPLISQMIRSHTGWEVSEETVVPDETEKISGVLLQWVEDSHLDLIITSGGTGFSPRDMTPEATRAVIEREAPGLSEAMRAAGLRSTPYAMLSRAVCGIRAHTLIVNLPGSPKAVKEGLEVLFPVLPHALELLTANPNSGSGHHFPQLT